jgi:hypothetical protein
MKSPLADVTKEEFAKLRKTLGSDNNIARLFGVTRQAVFSLRANLGIPPNRTPDSLAERNKLINKDFKKGIAVPVIAKKYKITKVYAYFLRRKFYKGI